MQSNPQWLEVTNLLSPAVAQWALGNDVGSSPVSRRPITSLASQKSAFDWQLKKEVTQGPQEIIGMVAFVF